MADFPYTPNPASVKRFLEHVQTAGVPEKVTIKYLEKVGFKSKNDRYVLGVLKFLGLVDTAGVPTKAWQAYRSKVTAGAVLAGALKKGYADLFLTYPDAHRKDNEALRNYFSAHTKVAESTLALIVSTFRTLANIADFDAATVDVPGGSRANVGDAETGAGGDVEEPRRAQRRHVQSHGGSPAVNINIQLTLPAIEDASIYDKLFAAMKKHLFPEPPGN